MNKDLLNKVKVEQPLTAEESLRLDAALEAQERVASVVSGLPDEAPSLSWRSELNQRLARVSRTRRAGPVWRFGIAAVGMAAVSLMVISLLQPVPSESGGVKTAVAEGKAKASLEDAILAEHNDATSQASLGVHVSYNEAGF
jgi:hypothetical protein